MRICIYQQPMYSFLLIYQSKISRIRYMSSYYTFSNYAVGALRLQWEWLILMLKQVTYPILLRTSSYSRLWYKPDTMFFIPKAYVKIDFHCPYAGNSPESEVLTDIFTRLLTDYLNEYGTLSENFYSGRFLFGICLSFGSSKLQGGKMLLHAFIVYLFHFCSTGSAYYFHQTDDGTLAQLC